MVARGGSKISKTVGSRYTETEVTSEEGRELKPMNIHPYHAGVSTLRFSSTISSRSLTESHIRRAYKIVFCNKSNLGDHNR